MRRLNKWRGNLFMIRTHPRLFPDAIRVDVRVIESTIPDLQRRPPIDTPDAQVGRMIAVDLTLEQAEEWVKGMKAAIKALKRARKNAEDAAREALLPE